ncbi:MAG TPA: glycosyltransferase family A protein [Terriglobales bacterium]|nr:glycosyltransferase family A protein [Terriglobales bacterium]
MVVCTRRRPAQLRQCLESVIALNYPRFSILVVENDSAHGEAEGIARAFGASYRLCTQQGLSAARNVGARYCSSDLLAFLDDDAVCDPDWLLNAAPLFEDERVYVVPGKVTFHSDASCASQPTHEFDPGNRIVDRATDDWLGMTVFGGVGLGGNFIVRSSSVEEMGGFDERLGRGTRLHASEENLFLFRVVDAGYRVATSSGCVVRHPDTSQDAEVPMRAIAVSTAMVALVAIEYPQHLGRLARYLWGAIRRTPQPWRRRPVQMFEGMASRRQVYLALLWGPFLYILAAIRHLVNGTPSLEEGRIQTAERVGATGEAPKMRA